ncbi:hypothetical protein KFK09_025353 [Dendrobium nobile]|uniref:Uncharacterized protein n=1 Tax=Dendrobium nobile TaxID=94219 RepID=A0A8T3AGB0_DENNO|nr:hypothetical protein KFK09_025353 [Dendrobium nobile]
MSLNQGPEALLEGSNCNLSYQTVSNFNELILESIGSTRRIQRAQDHQIPTSLRPPNVQRMVHDRRAQYRPSIQTTPYSPMISHLFTSYATPEKKEEKEEAPPRPPPELFPPPEDAGTLLDFRETSGICRTL